MALGLTQEQAAKKIDRALRFYARVGLGDVSRRYPAGDLCHAEDSPDSLLSEQKDNDDATDLDLFIESLSDCAPEHKAAIIELGRVYLRSLK